MKMYDFHGTIPQNEIGKELRSIVRCSGEDFKVLTGYGSLTGNCMSKPVVMKSLRKMRKEGLIKAFMPAECCTEVIWAKEEFYDAKMLYNHRIASDKDARIGNSGIIFVFVR